MQQQQQQVSYSGMNVGPPGVVCLPVPVQSRIYDRYLNKQSIGLGIAQVVIGALCAIFNLVILVTSSYNGGLGEAGHGFWCGALFVITGSLGISAGAKRQRCQIVSFMVMCIISAIFTISLLTIASIGAAIVKEDCDYYGYYYDRNGYYPYYSRPCQNMNNYGVVVSMEALMAALAIVEAIVAIWGSAICCKSGVCCCSRPVQTTVIPANCGYLSYNGQLIYLGHTQVGQGGGAYAQQIMNPYPPAGLNGTPYYTANYIQPNWTMPPPPQNDSLPAYANPPVNQEPPEYSPYNEASRNANEPAKF